MARVQTNNQRGISITINSDAGGLGRSASLSKWVRLKEGSLNGEGQFAVTTGNTFKNIEKKCIPILNTDNKYKVVKCQKISTLQEKLKKENTEELKQQSYRKQKLLKNCRRDSLFVFLIPDKNK